MQATKKENCLSNENPSTVSTQIANHHGFGVRTDEEPFAHKIPPGGNWRDLPVEDQLVYWNGSLPSHGGCTNGLRRKKWDEPAGTITTAPIQKLSCQLHPGDKTWEEDIMIENHDKYPERKIGGRREERIPTSWSAPAPTLCTGGGVDKNGKFGGVSSPIHPDFYRTFTGVANHAKTTPSMFSEIPTYDSCNRLREWDEPAMTIRGQTISGLPWHPSKKQNNVVQFPGHQQSRKPLLDSWPPRHPQGIRAVSLFSGGGLLDLGLIHAGVEIIWAAEFDMSAAAAYRHNIGDHIVGPSTRTEAKTGIGDLTKIKINTIPSADILVGGPPCQDFSLAGNGEGEDGNRGKLVWTYFEILKCKRFPAFLFENVKGLTTAKHRHTFYALISEFESIGYSVSWKVLNAWDYGIAQTRERVFLIGIDRGKMTSLEHRSLVKKLRAISEQLRHTEDRKEKRALIKKGDAILDKLHESHVEDGTAFLWPPSVYATTGYRPVLRDAIGDLPEPGVKVKNHKIDVGLPKYVENVLTGKTTTNFGQGIRVNDGELPAKTILASYISNSPMEVYSPNLITTPLPLNDSNESVYTGKAYLPLLTDGSHCLVKTMVVEPSHKLSSQRNIWSWSQPSATITGARIDHPPIHPEPLINHGPRDYFLPAGCYETYDQANRVQNMDSPYTMIPVHHNNGQPIHLEQKPRRFTVRECLRIQSAPDSYVFPDVLSLSAMYKITGNGVPPVWGYLLGEALSEQLLAMRGEKDVRTAA